MQDGEQRREQRGAGHQQGERVHGGSHGKGAVEDLHRQAFDIALRKPLAGLYAGRHQRGLGGLGAHAGFEPQGQTGGRYIAPAAGQRLARQVELIVGVAIVVEEPGHGVVGRAAIGEQRHGLTKAQAAQIVRLFVGENQPLAAGPACQRVGRGLRQRQGAGVGRGGVEAIHLGRPPLPADGHAGAGMTGGQPAGVGRVGHKAARVEPRAIHIDVGADALVQPAGQRGAKTADQGLDAEIGGQRQQQRHHRRAQRRQLRPTVADNPALHQRCARQRPPEQTVRAGQRLRQGPGRGEQHQTEQHETFDDRRHLPIHTDRRQRESARADQQHPPRPRIGQHTRRGAAARQHWPAQLQEQRPGQREGEADQCHAPGDGDGHRVEQQLGAHHRAIQILQTCADAGQQRMADAEAGEQAERAADHAPHQRFGHNRQRQRAHADAHQTQRAQRRAAIPQRKTHRVEHDEQPDGKGQQTHRGELGVQAGGELGEVEPLLVGLQHQIGGQGGGQARGRVGRDRSDRQCGEGVTAKQ